MQYQGRGQLTDRIIERSKKLFGREITREELRLMAYTQFVLMNDQKFDMNKLSVDEVLIINAWGSAGYLIFKKQGKVGCTSDFWQMMNSILYLGYVDITVEEK